MAHDSPTRDDEIMCQSCMRAIRDDRGFWVHAETGAQLCDPTGRSGQMAQPREADRARDPGDPDLFTSETSCDNDAALPEAAPADVGAAESIANWFDEGIELGATNMIVVADDAADEFSQDSHPIYVKVEPTVEKVERIGQVLVYDDVLEVAAAFHHCEAPTQKVLGIYNLAADKEEQLACGREYNSAEPDLWLPPTLEVPNPAEEWDAVIGQAELKRKLRPHIESALDRVERLEHVLLSGPEGTGKACLAGVMARWLGERLVVLTMPMERRALVRALRNFDGGILLIEELDALSRRDQEVLLTVLSESVVIDAHGRRFPIPWLTVIGTTTDPAKIIDRLYEGFPIALTLERYGDTEFAGLIAQNFGQKKWFSDEETSDLIDELVRRCVPTPRVAEQLVQAAERLRPLGETVTADAIIDWCGPRCERQVAVPATGRVAIASNVRRFVWARDDGTCQECFKKPPEVLMQFDHIVPIAMGGSNEAENLQLLCEACNRKKGARL